MGFMWQLFNSCFNVLLIVYSQRKKYLLKNWGILPLPGYWQTPSWPRKQAAVFSSPKYCLPYSFETAKIGSQEKMKNLGKHFCSYFYSWFILRLCLVYGICVGLLLYFWFSNYTNSWVISGTMLYSPFKFCG